MSLNETNKHYDISPEFFKSFLDSRYMKYTSGHFENADGPETAAQNMLDSHIKPLKNFSSPKILEVGPGWGAFLKRIRELEIPCEYTAINPSTSQNQFIRNNIDPDVRIIESVFEEYDFRNHKFDAIYFIGSFCHMKDLRKQLEKARALLTPKGRIVIEDVFFLNEDLYQKHHSRLETSFVQSEVFGYAYIPSLSRFVEDVFAKNLQINSLTDHTLNYFKTIETWLAKIKNSNHPNSIEFEKYLSIAQRGWGHTIGNYSIELQPMVRIHIC